MVELAKHGFRAIAPDLRGIGGTSIAPSGYSARSIALDQIALLDALAIDEAAVVGFDISLQAALILALKFPERINRLVLCEALAGDLPGADDFLKKGAPWWFGFHSAPGLAEQVLEGHEDKYLEFFYRNTLTPLSQDMRTRFIQAYRGKDRLRGGFEHYRAFPESAAEIREELHTKRIRQPTLIIGGGVVKDAPYQQLKPYADKIDYVRIESCGHIVPGEKPLLFAKSLIDHLQNTAISVAAKVSK